MSGLNRRGFLQLLGLGGLGVASGVVPLFGSDSAPGLITPDAGVISGHLVVQRKSITEKIPEDDPTWDKYKNSAYRPVARLTRTQVPGGGKLESLDRHEMRIEPRFPDGTDPHAVYYKASHELRARIAALSQKTLDDLPWELRGGATLVTVVETPIIANPRPDKGFDVVAYFRQGIVYRTDGLDTFNIYSKTGEYPIEVPHGIRMSMLMKLDRQVLSDSTLLHRPASAWRIT